MPGDAPGAYRRNFATDVLLNRRTRAVAYGIHQGHVVTQVQRERSTQGPCRPRSTTRGRCAWGGPRAVDQQLLQEIRSVNAAPEWRCDGAGQLYPTTSSRITRSADLEPCWQDETVWWRGEIRWRRARLNPPGQIKERSRRVQKKASSASKRAATVFERQLHRVHVADTTSHCRKPIFVRLSSLAGALLRMPITRARGYRSDET